MGDSISTLANVEKPLVEVMTLKAGNFYKEIISNGKLYAIWKVDLQFRVSEIIQRIFVHNGQKIDKGTILAEVEESKLKNQLKRAKSNYEKACLEMQDQLISMGVNNFDSTQIPSQKWKVASIKSGFENAVLDLEIANYDYKNRKLIAPFGGIVCNLRGKEGNLSTQDVFCTLIENSTFEAEFSIMESELNFVYINQPVLIIAFSGDSITHQGIISEINPIINENGLVKVKAKIINNGHNLFEGMNVHIIVRKVFANKLVVPKQAVLERQGRKIVFTVESGQSIWNYVKITGENSTNYSIEEDDEQTELQGKDVIISGNLNLAHEAEVEVKNK